MNKFGLVFVLIVVLIIVIAMIIGWMFLQDAESAPAALQGGTILP